jgi:hypothetical protein
VTSFVSLENDLLALEILMLRKRIMVFDLRAFEGTRKKKFTKDTGKQ